MLRSATLTALALTLGPSLAPGVGAQVAERGQPVVPAHARIRVQWADGRVATGHLLRPLYPGTVELAFCAWPAPHCPSPDSSRVVHRPLAEVAQLEWRTGQRTVRGALLGGATALGTLSLLLLAVPEDRDAPRPDGRDLAVRLGGVTLAGAVIGGLIGSGQGRWVRIR